MAGLVPQHHQGFDNIEAEIGAVKDRRERLASIIEVKNNTDKQL